MFDRALEFVLAREGGFSNDVADPGGATNYGITQATYNKWRAGKEPYPVKDISLTEVATIYHERFWLPSGCESFPGHQYWPLAIVHFDGAVNHGTNKRNRFRCVRFLQRALGVSDDGVIGPVTLEALGEINPDGSIRRVAENVVWQRLAFYRRIVQQRSLSLKFLPGWVRRMEHLREEVLLGWRE